MIKNNKIKCGLWGVLTIIQLGILYAIYYIDSIIFKKAGLNHHMYYMKTEYSKTIFTENNILLMKIGFMILAVVFLVYFVVNVIKNKKLNVGYIPIVVFVLLAVGMSFALTSEVFTSKLYYPYAMFAGFAITAIQIIKIPIVK